MFKRYKYFKHITLFLVIVVFATTGFVLQYSPLLHPLKNYIQTTAVPTELLSYNKLGELFRKLKLVKTIPNHSERYKQDIHDVINEDNAPFQKRRQISGALLAPGKEHEMLTRARTIIKDKALHSPNLFIAIETEKENISGPQGILTNYYGHGKKWERLGYVAMYKGAELISNSAVGMRLHGGKTRDPALDKHNYRIYYRKKYGYREVESDHIFSKPEQLRTVVIHKSAIEEWPLNNIIANSLYRMAGVPTLDYSPAHFYLNGESQGIYWVSPHLSEKYIKANKGLKSIFYQRFKGKGTLLQYKKDLGKYAFDFSIKLTQRKINTILDVSTLTNYLIAVSFTGNTDWNQGVAYRDTKKTHSVWRWIAWDLDHSFIDWYKSKNINPNQPGWQQKGMELLLKDKIHRIKMRRLLIFRRLLIEDPGYKKAFLERYIYLLNHEFSPKNLKNFYLSYEEEFSHYNIAINPLLEEFLEHRHHFIEQDLMHHFDLQPFQNLKVVSDDSLSLSIDGYKEDLPYSGRYPKGTQIRLEVTKENAKGKGSWLVNGIKKDVESLSLSIENTTTISYSLE